MMQHIWLATVRSNLPCMHHLDLTAYAEDSDDSHLRSSVRIHGSMKAGWGLSRAYAMRAHVGQIMQRRPCLCTARLLGQGCSPKQVGQGLS